MINSKILLLTTAVGVITANAEDYSVNFPGENISHGSRYTTALNLNGSADGDQSVPTSQKLQGPLYEVVTANCFSARPGETLTPAFEFAGAWMNGYVYIDYNQDGTFDFTINDDGTPATASELVSYSHYHGKTSTGAATSSNTLVMPPFTIPADLAPGVYRIRYKVDWDNIDPAGNDSPTNSITANGGIIADAMLAVHGTDDTATLTLADIEHGSVLQADGNALPDLLTQGAPVALKLVPDDGYAFDYLVVTHSYDQDFEHGNINAWSQKLTKDQLRMIGNKLPGNCTVGDKVMIEASFTEKGDADLGADKYAKQGYELVWSDEFNSPDGSHPDFENKWINSPRRTSTWNKRNSSREDLYVIEDGILHLYAKPNEDTSVDNAPMLTAAMETTGKFAFTHGIVEARIKLNPHTGNFPAFWMMPETGFNGGWPFCGEIDIMEQIDNEQRTYHTLHGYWTNDKSMSVSSTFYSDVTQYHDYTLKWTPEGMTWYVDGNKAYSFSKDRYNSDKYPYPFDRPFHIILNQAVGDGSWARPFDATHTYLTQVDYVRVYQLVEGGVSDVAADIDSVRVTPVYGGVNIEAAHSSVVDIYTVTGAKAKSVRVDGSAHVALPTGFYIINNQKVAVR